MKEIAIYLKDIWKGLNEDDIIAIAAAEYITNEYVVEVDDDDLDDIKSYIDDDYSHNFLTRIENTFANIDREYCEEEDEEDSYWDTDESYDDDYEDDEYDEDEVDNETMRLIEQNRKKNEQALGL